MLFVLILLFFDISQSLKNWKIREIEGINLAI